MSRTYKDIPRKYSHPEEAFEKNYYICPKTFRLIKLPTDRPKKKKKKDTMHHWMTTPGWWISLMMNSPQRAAGKVWENEVRKMRIEDLEEVTLPSVSRKPHVYYW